MQRQNVPLLRKAPVAEAVEVDTEAEGYTPTARVGLISHIGGHKWAGNVILYFPPLSPGSQEQWAALAGKGVWYGRVEPRHVEGIVRQTLRGGRLIRELLRGVHEST